MLVYLQMIETPENQSKFEKLYERYRDTMFCVAFKILKNEYDAEDAVHQAFLSIILNLNKIKEIECPQTYSYVVIITERKALDIIRANKKLGTSYDDSIALEIAMPDSADDTLASAMATLPTHYREILLLRFDNGYSTKELAGIMGMSRANIQKLIWRAKKALAETLQKEEYLNE